MNSGMKLKMLAVPALFAFGFCLQGWGQDVVKPEQGESTPDSQILTAAEREMLVSMTRVRIGGGGDAPVTRQEQPAERDQVDIIELVERVDQLLARLSRSKKDGDHALILGLMESQIAAVRVTALNWAVGVGSLAVDALIKGVQDSDELVRESALTHLVGFGLEKAAIDGVREKVEKGQDLFSFRHALRLAVASRQPEAQ